MNRKTIMFDSDWKEITESPGELWDIPELKDVFDEDSDIEIDDQSIEDFCMNIQYDY